MLRRSIAPALTVALGGLALLACTAAEPAPAAPAPTEPATVTEPAPPPPPPAPAAPSPAERLAAGEAFLAEFETRPGVVKTASGLLYTVTKAGDPAGATPAPGQWVCVHYRGTLIDGTEFDSSYSRGAPAAFPSNRLIPGWVEALALMRPGDAWSLAIHPTLGYGDRGTPGGPIGPNEALLFDVEMIRLLDGPVAPSADCSTV